MHPLFTRKIAVLRELATQGGCLHDYIGTLGRRWADMETSQTLPDAQEVMALLDATQRVEMFYAAGQKDNTDLWQELQEKTGPIWGAGNEDTFVAYQPGDNTRLATHLIRAVQLDKSDHLCLYSQYFSKDIAHKLADHCLKEGVDFSINITNSPFPKLLKHRSSNEALEGLLKWFKNHDAQRTKIIALRANIPPMANPPLNAEEEREMNARCRSASHHAGITDTPPPQLWSVTYQPTAFEAELDGTSYQEYKKLLSEACDQPWSEIQEAQGKLVAALNAGKEMRITNDDGTDIGFSIEGHSFANSGAVRNIPGSEIFSAPVKNSVNGTIVAKGRFKVPSRNGVMEDITLHVKDGRIDKWEAQKGKEFLDAVITLCDNEPETLKDGTPNPKFEGTRYFGEIGFGTNPHLRRHMVNSLLVEKICGSFHMAIGKAYPDGYLGDATVKLDNGNRAVDDLHWDVTTMLRGKNGKVWLDGHLMQKDGNWQAVPELGITEQDVAVLNDGWRALKKSGLAIPKYWADKYTAEDRAASAAR